MTVRRPQESAVDPLSDEFIRYRRQKGWAAEHTLLDEIDRQRATIRGLEAENARLREALERMRKAMTNDSNRSGREVEALIALAIDEALAAPR